MRDQECHDRCGTPYVTHYTHTYASCTCRNLVPQGWNSGWQ